MSQNMAPRGPSIPGTANILVVEDVETTRRRLVDTLRVHGYHAEEAVNGLQALQKLAERRFDAILLDLVLPDVDGWQFRQAQLRHPELASIPTIFVTVRALREPDRYALRATEVVLKPFEDNVLLTAIEHACARVDRGVPPPETYTAHLFWSKRGEVACWNHAPVADTPRWYVEGWSTVPERAGYGRIVYQCQHCPGNDGPVERHRKLQDQERG